MNLANRVGMDNEMEKKLSEMTLEELWELFPISLVNHNDDWAQYYAEAQALLSEALADCSVLRISHIGSTAVAGICAKNIVDILLELDPSSGNAMSLMEKAAARAEKIGYIRMSGSDRRISLNKGYTPTGFDEKVYHLHIRLAGDNDELYFRDYLNEYPETAAEYERMKFDSQRKYEHDRDAYTNAKTEFVKKYTAEARKIYKGRY